MLNLTIILKYIHIKFKSRIYIDLYSIKNIQLEVNVIW